MFDFAKIGEAGKVMADAATDMRDEIQVMNVHLNNIEAYIAELHKMVVFYFESKGMTIHTEIEKDLDDGSRY